jgi:ASC-1-like (ASCH) protein
MDMKKTIYAISDVHGYCAEMKKALDEAGFRANDDACVLIVDGDCVDRGEESKEVFEFLNGIQNKIMIRGNHEDMLELLLEKKHMGRAGFSNGIDRTLVSFFGERVLGDLDVFYQFSYRLCFDGKEDTVSALRDFIGNTYDYYETENYVFTHGWLPIDFDEESRCFVREDFRYADVSDWKRARFTEWYRAYASGARLEGKTIVCGHRASRFAALIDGTRNPMDTSVFLADGVAAIDGSTMQSRKVNVLVLEDEIPEPQTHEMSLRTEPFRRIGSGHKRVELRLCDEKRSRIRVGDRIVFTHTENVGEKLEARVLGLHKYLNFDLVGEDIGFDLLGLDERKESLSEYMRAYYSDEEVEQYGVLAIRVEIIRENG